VIALQIIVPDKVFIDDEFEYIVVPGEEGVFGVLSDHTPFISKIKPGILKLYKKEEGKPENYAIHDGFAYIDSNSMKIVCDVIEHGKKIDKDRAKKAKNRAKTHLGKQGIDVARARFALQRALARLESIA